jgi:hypothetical protein
MAALNFRIAKTEEEQLWAPLALALVNFVLVKSVLSSENTIPLAFIFVGCVLGLLWQQRERNKVGSVAAAVAALPNAPARRTTVPAARLPQPGRA